MTKPRHLCDNPEICIKCIHAKELREWRLKNKDKVKEYQEKYNQKYYEKNREEIVIRTAKYHIDNREKQNKRKRDYRSENQEYFNKLANKYYYDNYEDRRKKQKKYYDINKEILNKKQYQYKRKKYYSDVEFRLKEILSARMRQALLTKSKSASTETLVGCTIAELRTHIEKQFLPGMNWENHAITGWHIDHIIPCDSFDLTDEEQQKKCFNYTNLQPLWYLDNLKKSNSLGEVHEDKVFK